MDTPARKLAGRYEVRQILGQSGMGLVYRGYVCFFAMLSKGHRLLNCTDVNTYILFQMDDNNFYRTVIKNGQKGDEIKIPHKTEKKLFVRFKSKSVPMRSFTRSGRATVGWSSIAGRLPKIILVSASSVFIFPATIRSHSPRSATMST